MDQNTMVNYNLEMLMVKEHYILPTVTSIAAGGRWTKSMASVHMSIKVGPSTSANGVMTKSTGTVRRNLKMVICMKVTIITALSMEKASSRTFLDRCIKVTLIETKLRVLVAIPQEAKLDISVAGLTASYMEQPWFTKLMGPKRLASGKMGKKYFEHWHALWSIE